MQIFALDENNRRISASNALRQKDYFCFECNHIVRARGGERRQFHFYHVRSSNDCRQNGKSLEHLITQTLIQQAIQKKFPLDIVSLEHKFLKIGRIADVAWLNRHLIFEIQCSSTTPEEIERRNNDYARLGFQVIWILHDRLFNRYHVSAVEEFLKYSPHYFTNINAQGKGVIYDQLSLVRKNRRFKRSSLFPVNIYTPQMNPKTEPLTDQSSSRLLSLMLERRLKWPLFFAGDVLDQASSSQLQNFSLLSKQPSFTSFIKNELLSLFRTLFYIFLEKTTK